LFAALLKHKGLNVKGLLKAAHTNEQAPLISSNIGKLQVFKKLFHIFLLGINYIFMHSYESGKSKESVPLNKYGRFFNTSCYIVLYSYPGDRKDDYILFYWLGRQSTVVNLTSMVSIIEYSSEVSIYNVKIYINANCFLLNRMLRKQLRYI
jgi:gelsolin